MAGPEVLIPLGAFVMITSVVHSVLKYKERTRSHTLDSLPMVGELSARLERIEQAIEAIAVEVERVSEGQRFTTKLLSERAEPLAQSAGARQIGGTG